MWDVTGWAIRTWLRVTVLLAVGVAAAWLWLSPGWFTACAGFAVIAELWTIRGLAREWTWHAGGHWWWSR